MIYFWFKGFWFEQWRRYYFDLSGTPGCWVPQVTASALSVNKSYISIGFIGVMENSFNQSYQCLSLSEVRKLKGFSIRTQEVLRQIFWSEEWKRIGQTANDIILKEWLTQERLLKYQLLLISRLPVTVRILLSLMHWFFSISWSHGQT